jgi:hypothetical protein
MATDIAFAESTPSWRTLPRAFDSAFYLFEPISAWLVSRQSVCGLGPFNPAVTVARVPLIDWLLRFWRAGLRHVNEPRITVVKNNVHRNVAGVPQYAEPGSFFAAISELVEGRTVDEIRAEIARRQTERAAGGGRVRDFITLSEGFAGRLTPAAAQRFLETGEDAFAVASREAGLENGQRLQRALRLRTGEAVPTPPDFSAMLRAARDQLS